MDVVLVLVLVLVFCTDIIICVGVSIGIDSLLVLPKLILAGRLPG